MDLPAALSLLHGYSQQQPQVDASDPTSSPPTSRDRAMPPLPRSVSVYAGQPLPESFNPSHLPLTIPSSDSGLQAQLTINTARGTSPSPRPSKTPPLPSPPNPPSSGASTRRHSRSSFHEGGNRLTFPLSPISTAEPLSHASHALSPVNNGSFPIPPSAFQPTNTGISSSSSQPDNIHPQRSPHRTSRPPSFSSYSFDSSSAPSAIPRSQTNSSSHPPGPASSYSPAINQHYPLPSTATASRRGSRNFDNDFDAVRSRSVSRSDLNQIMRSFNNSRPRRSYSRQVSHADLANLSGDPVAVAEPSQATLVSGTVTTEASPDQVSDLRRSTRSMNASNTDLKTLIQQKRRQASAPFYTSARVRSGTTSPVHSQSQQGSSRGSPVLGSVLTIQSPVQPDSPLPQSDKQPWEYTPPRRARSRHGTSMGLNGITAFTASADGPVTRGFEEARLRAMRGVGELVMTPSIEVSRRFSLSQLF